MINKILFRVVLSIIDILDSNNKKKIINFFKESFSDRKIIVVDIGAHKGETIDIFLKYFNIEKIYSFEPNDELFIQLKRKNYDFERIKLFNLGIGEFSEIKNLNIFKDTSSSTLNTINENSDYFKKKKKIMSFLMPFENFFKKKIIITICNLSEIIQKQKIKKIDILKIDTEGYEFNVLKGIVDSDFKYIRFIYFEHHYDLMINKGYKFSDINNLLKKKNFKLKYKLKMKFRKSFEYIYENSK